MIPGLLQTEEYARHMSRGGPRELDRDDIDRRVQVRMERQRIPAREDRPRLWAVIDEAVIRRVVGGPEVMREQLRHLVDCAEEGKTTLQVVPFSAGAHAGTTGPFIILEFPEVNGACVEVATNLPGTVAVRDSKRPGGPKLLVSAAGWQAFVRSLKVPDAWV